MSMEAVAAVLHHSQASPHAKLVLTTIALFESDRGAWMSQATLAKMCNMTERSVRRHIKELRTLYELDVIPDDGQGYGARNTNRYYIIVDCPEGCDRSLSHKQNSAEVIKLTESRREQYRSKVVAIQDKNGRNTGQKLSQ